MKPLRPTGGPPVPTYDQKPALWATGSIFGLSGLVLCFTENPLVPLSHVFHLIPIGLGGAIGTAIMREKQGPRWIWAYVVFMMWLTYATLTNQTTIGIVMLAAGLFSLTRAIVQTAALLE